LKYRADIDGLRAIAVLPVVLFHAGFELFGGGFVGVDVFFVISGFLITGLIRNECARGTFSFRVFYLRRARRLLPALLATLMLSLAAGYWMLPPSDMRALGQSAFAALLSLSNMLFWLQSGYFDNASHLKPLLHTWSLSVEEQFYLVWPLALVLGLRLGSRAWLPGLIAAGVIGSLLGCEIALSVDPSAAFFFLPFRAFELGLGALLAFLPPLVSHRNAWREACTATGLGMIFLAVFLYSESTRFPGFSALLPCVGAALVLVGGEAQYVGALLRNRIARGV
jgi:peptidoglycan/LPS O-acetylase OafA/YrhL